MFQQIKVCAANWSDLHSQRDAIAAKSPAPRNHAWYCGFDENSKTNSDGVAIPIAATVWLSDYSRDY